MYGPCFYKYTLFVMNTQVFVKVPSLDKKRLCLYDKASAELFVSVEVNGT